MFSPDRRRHSCRRSWIRSENGPGPFSRGSSSQTTRSFPSCRKDRPSSMPSRTGRRQRRRRRDVSEAPLLRAGGRQPRQQQRQRRRPRGRGPWTGPAPGRLFRWWSGCWRCRSTTTPSVREAARFPLPFPALCLLFVLVLERAP